MKAGLANPLSAVDPTELRWHCAVTAAGAAVSPDRIAAGVEWLAASVPGTVAGALRDAGRLDLDALPSFTDRDYWYRSDLVGAGARVLRLHGLATLAEVWLDDALLLRSDNMFVRHDIDIALTGRHSLWLRFRALDSFVPTPSQRARWRPIMIPRRSLRSLRTSLLGHMPGWCPAMPVVGPWRRIELLDPQEAFIERRQLHASLATDGSGTLDVDVSLQGPQPAAASIECAGVRCPLERHDRGWRGRLHLQCVEPWWPHTHGEPRLYPVTLHLQARTPQRIDLGRVGFRRIRIDRGADSRDFAVCVNDVRIFCRGANWISADLAGVPDRHECFQPWIERMREAGMNMVRVGGTTIYESSAFYELCDAAGLLVWQDFMFANFDYPVDDPGFRASVDLEARQFLERTSGSPSIAVLCGGSEVAQQAAMLGLPATAWRSTLFDEWLPAIAGELRPDVPYVDNSPSGGALPFVADAGVTHYYGVGAYRRPLEDARRARVRFASECLAFANVPEPVTLRLDNLDPATPRWKRRAPRDLGADWDFEDVRDHYLSLRFGVDAEALRRSDPDRYLALSRATSAAVMETTLAEWRRHGSTCNGALVWTLHDPWPGAGWGVIDATGEPKSTWYALRRAFRSRQIVLTDEGLNGLAIHCINESAAPLHARLELTCYSGRHAVAGGHREIRLAARSSSALSSAELLGAFFDITWAYRFGPPAHDITLASLLDAATGERLADAFHFPHGLGAVRPVESIEAQPAHAAGRWWLTLAAPTAAVAVHIEDAHYRAADNGFHLAPGDARRIELLPRDRDVPPPAGTVTALNSMTPVAYGEPRP